MSEETRPKTPRKSDAQQQAPSAENAREEARYSRDDLREGARSLFGVHPLIVAGALGRLPASQETFTAAEVKQAVREHTSSKIDPREGVAA